MREKERTKRKSVGFTFACGTWNGQCDKCQERDTKTENETFKIPFNREHLIGRIVYHFLEKQKFTPYRDDDNNNNNNNDLRVMNG